ncbi:EamA family transporter [Filimonas effusa]|uniref:EamA/RhaT family transporter n=1 Tax=Filimonas effusa TaxID=2508721 RepID=A0A4Q1D2N2_9BACT|nr:DMT family transporter [Filimonas effusa]RXK81325.1 EamA/RhaT family transporter [Filimonas effusa]
MKKLKGIIFVIAGAASYGILATFVKLAGSQGYSTASVTFAQFITGFIVLAVADLLFRKKAVSPPEASAAGKKDFRKLVLGGTCLGLTSTFYYLSVQYLPVSVCIILLMQTVWMGILVDCVRNKKLPQLSQILVILVVLAGTVLATGLITAGAQWSFRGMIYGFMAAMTYTGSMYAANHVALRRPLFYRSKLLVLGGLLAIIIFWNLHIISDFRPEVLLKWGIFLGVFGTILPPVLFSKGFPAIGLSLGSVLAAIEIPVSIVTAHIVLHENVTLLQLLGCALIILGIALQNKAHT